MSTDEDDYTQPTPAAPPRPQTVQTKSLRPNPHNPRMLFDEEPLVALQQSIEKVGILVPLTVYQASGSKKFTILDGQRRWICAERIGLDDVPINQVTEPSLTQNIVTMFQIHKLRKDWDLMPTALKLGVLMDELDERGDSTLAELTGLDTAVVTRCKKLLSYEAEFHDLMLYSDPEKRLKADLFIEMYPIITDRSITSTDWFERVPTIHALIRKYSEGLSGFRAVTDFRKIKSYLTAARKADKIEELLKRLKLFFSSDAMTISDLEIDAARIHREADLLSRNLIRIAAQIGEIDPDEFIAEEGLWVALEELRTLIEHKLEEGERRFN